MKSKATGIIKKILIALLCIILVIALCTGGFFIFYKPTVTFDAADLTGNVTNGASGYLYGIAEDGVPSYSMAESLDISSISTKTQGGLQHPIAEVGDIAGEVTASGSCDYIVVYLQDMYSTWYYDEKAITLMKQNGTYDWKKYVENKFFPLIQQTVNDIKNSDYSDKVVYCLYNECDNAVWFGNWVEDPENENGGYSEFEAEGRGNFFNAWKLTYDYVKSLDPDALIGGPGYYEYSSNKMDDFFSFTSANDCTPDIMIYHELNYRSVYDWQYHVSDLKELEKKYGISEDTPVIVTEYGMMEDNGNPNTMLKYITQIEYSKVYANQAYWLLANNFCNTCADYNTPNSAWWVYRWYTDMSGQTMASEISDILHSDVGRAIKEKRAPRYRQFMGLGTITDEKDKIEILVSGADYSGNVKINNLEGTELFGNEVFITVSAVTYQGILGKVYQPETVKRYTAMCKDTLKIEMPDMDENTAYRIEINKLNAAEEDAVSEDDYILDEETDNFTNDNLYIRYEFEEGKLLGNAYTYDSAYATTGDQNGMVGGMENDGDGVEITVNAPQDGEYELKFIYGNSNDGRPDADGKQNPDDRTFSEVHFSVDDEESVLSLSNTIKSEITNSYTVNYRLEKGKHTIKFTHNAGAIVLDSMLMRRSEDNGSIAVLRDADRSSASENCSSFLAIADTDGYYDIKTLPNSELLIDGIPAETDENGIASVYFCRGLNYIDVLSDAETSLTVSVSEKAGNVIKLEPESAMLFETAALKESKKAGVSYIDGISSDGGSAVYAVNAPDDGTYRMTLLYSNNDENGIHDYNVDLVERFVTVSVNSEKQKELYCRNTYSWDTFETVTINVELKQGDNYIQLFNDGFNLFNGNTTYAPYISGITINEISAD